MNPLAGQDEHETLETLFCNIDSSFAEKAVCRYLHTAGPGRHPRSPVGLFRAFIVMHMKGVRSLREMTRLLDVDVRLRKICLLKKGEKGYPRSVLSRFARKVGADKLESIIEDKVVALLKRSSASDVDAVLDASFVKAWSTRHPKDSQTGFSDGEARVGRAGRTFGLGYKLPLSIDSENRLPLANVVAPTNENEKRHTPTLLEKTRQILSNAGAKLKRVIADSQYNDEKIRRTVEAVIPYPANQKRNVKGLLRVDKKFRIYGPEDLKRKYHKRPTIEAVYSFLKTQYGLIMNKARGLKSVATYALYSIMCLVLNREAAENTGRSDKAISPTYFNT